MFHIVEKTLIKKGTKAKGKIVNKVHARLEKQILLQQISDYKGCPNFDRTQN